MQYSIRSETGRWGEYWFISELARRGVRAQRLNEFETGTDIITQENQLIEIKTSIAHITRFDGQHRKSRGWSYNSIRKNTRRIADVFVFIALNDEDLRTVEHIWIVPNERLRTANGQIRQCFFIKDTDWQLENSPNINKQIRSKWIESYKDNWGVVWGV